MFREYYLEKASVILRKHLRTAYHYFLCKELFLFNYHAPVDLLCVENKGWGGAHGFVSFLHLRLPTLRQIHVQTILAKCLKSNPLITETKMEYKRNLLPYDLLLC